MIRPGGREQPTGDHEGRVRHGASGITSHPPVSSAGSPVMTIESVHGWPVVRQP